MTMTTTHPETHEAAIVPEAAAEIAEARREIALRRSPTEPTTFEQCIQLATIVAKSKMFGVASPEDAFVRLATGMDLGLRAMTALNLIDAIPGPNGPRPALRAKLKVALCLSSPLCEYFECVESTDQKATYRAKRVGRPEKVFTYTIDEAKGAGYTSKDNWKQNPRAMLRARAGGFLADMEFPDVVGNIATSEDLRDHQAVPASGEPVSEWKVAEVERKVVGFIARAKQVSEKRAGDALWVEVLAAVKAGDVTEAERDEIAAAMKARAAELGTSTNGKAPTPPKGVATAGAGQ